MTTESASLTARLFSFQGKGRGGHKVSQFLNMKKQRTANTSMLLPERGRPVCTVACDRKGSSTSGPPILRCSCRSADGPSARSLATEEAHPPVDRQSFDALAGARTARPLGRLRPKRPIQRGHGVLPSSVFNPQFSIINHQPAGPSYRRSSKDTLTPA